jgi:hypothetical protein
MSESIPESEPNRDVVTYLYWGALAARGWLAANALLQFYFSASRAITVWVTREYRPLFKAVFNLVVLLGAGIGISLVVRRLRVATEEPDGSPDPEEPDASVAGTEEPE